ncbi:MAG: 1-deoxy-D-xylulose-5-phosphate reductoisomerase [Bacteroidetes bacterium GWF2_41_61]|nr:MAG: 1-deoxy-D-xylulose-5-phosphate reductoisomerase [Bacteroidetes bacterium GWE2_40_15]OFY31297.1 MAG: 1-deoxy-D-xylulose-5-phosphate reductoisomerase [Bacteroidetes bacterium GWF2_41_61]OFY89517.1 MAG: 1-deoxy-D-xylulose-5-phosphate reductoisomerase [Bacteroidetes bacterium RIFOXYA12_FULL_40_10]HBG25353.1 1-deoxy-D-xylulose-5-phosphate reductoisomerase [Rikenellaceae bacterium]HBZ25353.1 1-deoxy-D-xylulose-5-phosphate reductoisomerase [Rikenellaceae bacterium]
MKRRIAILGSTGSIGKQALDVISRHPELFCAEVLTANSNSTLLIKQAIEHNVNSVVIADESKYQEVFKALDPYGIKVFTGNASVSALACGSNIDMVLTAMVGFSGLEPTISAIKAGKAVALANKETLVAAGSIVMKLAKERGTPIIPVDSEHSAIFQCLQGERASIEKIILTASGGPFLSKTKEEIETATVKEALNHPKWLMGPKVTIDSASMMNKGLEMIEAHWLFGIEPSKIEIVVHPQSIIHSMVQFSDGSVTAQLSIPDMRLPIQYALSYPYRVDLNTKRIDFPVLESLNFYKPDFEKFPCLSIAYSAIERGGNIPCAMNAANEIAVESFLAGEIPFTNIPDIILEVINSTTFVKEPSIEDIFETDKKARLAATLILTQYKAPTY